MLEKVTSYKMPDGSSHPDKKKAVAVWLQSYANAGWDYELPIEIAMRMIDQRGKIVELLQAYDTPEE